MNFQPREQAETHEPGSRPPEFTDEALALRFAETHAASLRYVAAWSKWLTFDGRQWAMDDTLHAFDLARKICRSAAVGCNKHKTSNALASAKTVAAVISLARADRRLAATTDQWDADPWVLNTPDGVVNLLTGQMRAHAAGDHFTKITAVSPGGKCPLWLKFLARITNDNPDLAAFLKRVAGYALTGITREHALFFLYGLGGNGKSVCIEAIAGASGDYHRTAPIETFTASNADRHPTDVAGLRGARLVTATETEEGRRWAESRIKTLTGGDKIAARFMRQDFFEYVPQFKLLIAGNHKPGLRSVDEAMRRRFHLIPFTVTIPEAERDVTLGEQLRKEWPGILQWMIEGCLEWQRIGLSPPPIVRDATAAYLANEDAFSAWIDEECERKGWEAASRLFSSWKTWAERSGENPGSLKKFREKIESRNFTPRRFNNARGYEGLQLLKQPEPEPNWSDR